MHFLILWVCLGNFLLFIFILLNGKWYISPIERKYCKIQFENTFSYYNRNVELVTRQRCYCAFLENQLCLPFWTKLWNEKYNIVFLNAKSVALLLRNAAFQFRCISDAYCFQNIERILFQFCANSSRENQSIYAKCCPIKKIKIHKKKLGKWTLQTSGMRTNFLFPIY